MTQTPDPKKFQRSLSALLQQREVVVAECEAGVYVAELTNGLVGPKDHTVRLIRYEAT